MSFMVLTPSLLVTFNQHSSSPFLSFMTSTFLEEVKSFCEILPNLSLSDGSVIKLDYASMALLQKYRNAVIAFWDGHISEATILSVPYWWCWFWLLGVTVWFLLVTVSPPADNKPLWRDTLRPCTYLLFSSHIPFKFSIHWWFLPGPVFTTVMVVRCRMSFRNVLSCFLALAYITKCSWLILEPSLPELWISHFFKDLSFLLMGSRF